MNEDSRYTRNAAKLVGSAHPTELIEVACAMILGSTSAFCAARVPYPLPDDPQLVHQ